MERNKERQLLERKKERQPFLSAAVFRPFFCLRNAPGSRRPRAPAQNRREATTASRPPTAAPPSRITPRRRLPRGCCCHRRCWCCHAAAAAPDVLRIGAASRLLRRRCRRPWLSAGRRAGAAKRAASPAPARSSCPPATQARQGPSRADPRETSAPVKGKHLVIPGTFPMRLCVPSLSWHIDRFSFETKMAHETVFGFRPHQARRRLRWWLVVGVIRHVAAQLPDARRPCKQGNAIFIPGTF